MKKLFALFLTLATLVSSVVSFAIPVSAATTVEAPTASHKSGFYIKGDVATSCGHSESNPGTHSVYTLWQYEVDLNVATTYSAAQRKAIKNKTAVPIDYEGEYSCTGRKMFCITLSTTTKGADIYFDMEYTNKEAHPKDTTKVCGIKYSVPIVISENTKITAYAVKNGARSKSVTYNYRIGMTAVFSHESGTYNNPINLEISKDGFGIITGPYTIDGSDPRTSPTAMKPDIVTGILGLYHSSYYIDRTCTFKVYIKGAEGQTGYVATKKYVIKNGSNKPIVTTPNEDIRESDLFDYKSKYYYNKFNSKQKKLYAKEFNYYLSEINGESVSSSSESTGLSHDELEEFWNGFWQENPQFNFVVLNWSDSLITSKRLNGELETAAAEILKEANKLSSDYEKVKYFHDTIIKNTKYTTFTNNHQTAYGALVDKKAVCRGYANAFAYLCQAAGIDCILVAGEGSSAAHDWNMVKLNGKWYHIDTLWDQTKSGIRYNYFLVSESQIKKDHKISNDISIPKASSNYSKTTLPPTGGSDTSNAKLDGKEITFGSGELCVNASPYSLDLGVGGKIDLSLIFNKTDGVKFSVDDTSVAKIVKSNGKYYVKGVDEGTALITAKCNGKVAQEYVEVYPMENKNSKLTISGKTSVKVGNEICLEAKISSGTDEYVNWFVVYGEAFCETKASSYSNHTKLIFTAKKKGTVTIKAVTSMGKCTDTIKITIK